MSDTPRTDGLAKREFVPDGLWIKHARELERENTVLREQNESLIRQRNDASKPYFTAQQLEIPALLRENVALREDKARLEWLFTHEGGSWLYWTAENGQWTPEVGASRAAIDAARKEAKP